jgi:ribonuclease T2
MSILKVSIAIIAALALCSATTVVADNSYDYLAYALQWVPYSCYHSSSPGCSLGNSMSIHGVWPSRNDGSYPQYCTSAKYDPSAISSIRDQMNHDWPSLKDSNYDSFWSHEYEKHGTCCQDILPTELAFFSQGLKLFGSYGNSTLMSVFPVGQNNSLDWWISAGKQAVGAKMQFQCRGSKIDAVQVCVDRTFNAIDCPNADQCSQSDSLYLENGYDTHTQRAEEHPIAKRVFHK